MPANVESMFYVRVAPWHNLGVCVEQALDSKEALEKSGLDWIVTQRAVMTDDRTPIPGCKANVRESDGRVLGVVTDRYKVVQNHEAFAFVDGLLGEGVRFETAGGLGGGRRVWMLAKLPGRHSMMDEDIDPYLVFSNSHDGNSGIRVAMTPIRVVCQNTLNLALGGAKRIWSTTHVGDPARRMDEARNTLLLARKYMDNLGEESGRLSGVTLSDAKVREYIETLLPMDDGSSEIHKRNILRIRGDLETRYLDAPDLRHVGKNAYRFICAVSDFATHAEPLRRTAGYRESMFARTMEGNPLIDKAYEIVRGAA